MTMYISYSYIFMTISLAGASCRALQLYNNIGIAIGGKRLVSTLLT